MQVDYDGLALASQVLRRQADTHVPRVHDYIRQHAILTPSDTGIVMLPFTGVSLAIALVGVQVVDAFGRICTISAQKVDDAAADYAAHERRAYEFAQRASQRLGTTLPPFTDPRGTPPMLGAAGSHAPADLGASSPDLLTQIHDIPKTISGDVSQVRDAVTGRIGDWQAAGTVAERSDAGSWLVAPNATKSEIENMRWGAGPILGGVDWLIQQLTGISLLEDVIMKPFAGNWTGIEEVQQAWTHVGEAMRALSDNAGGLAVSGAFWQGDAGTAYQGGMSAIGLAAFGLGAVADTVSGLVHNLVLASKAAAATIGFALKSLSERLLRMALEATVPVAGWVIAAAEGALAATQIFSTIRLIYSVINIILDAIESAIQARVQLVSDYLRLTDLVQVLSQAGGRYA
ncbi:MAG: hypothetical protein JST33_06960 [Actinobacteria bacterium]|nr:hypothetical protein [Actinomycetota bacterium]